MTPQEIAKDKRLRKQYGWTLAMYYALERLQEYKCAGCGREVKNMPMNVDHEHFTVDAQRIITEYPNPELMWQARASFKDGRYFIRTGKTKTEAIALVRQTALPHSVRGLLCPGRYAGCNRKLGRIDNIPWLETILGYLKNPPARAIYPLGK